MNYKQKYLKYKLKYLTAKKLYGGSDSNTESYQEDENNQDLRFEHVFDPSSDITPEESRRIAEEKAKAQELAKEKKRKEDKKELEDKLKIRPSEDELKQSCSKCNVMGGN